MDRCLQFSVDNYFIRALGWAQTEFGERSQSLVREQFDQGTSLWGTMSRENFYTIHNKNSMVWWRKSSSSSSSSKSSSSSFTSSDVVITVFIILVSFVSIVVFIIVIVIIVIFLVVAGASFQLFLGRPTFFFIFQCHRTIETLEKQHFIICSNLTLFIS